MELSVVEQADDVDVSPTARRLPGTVWATGWVSFFTDLSTELIYAVLPSFYATVLGLGAAAQGLIEGFAEAVASLVKLYSGHWSDRTGGRKWWMVGGYTLSTIAKPLLALAGGVGAVLALRSADRLGKGVRGAPRDALIDAAIHEDQRGRAFGIQRALDHAGAMSGGLIASGLLFADLVTERHLFWWTLLPGAIAVLMIVVFVREAPTAPIVRIGDTGNTGNTGDSGDSGDSGGASSTKLAAFSPRRAWRQQSPTMRRYLIVVAVFALGNSTDALLLLRAHDQMRSDGLTAAHATAMLPLLWSWLHLVKSAVSTWGGRLSDRVGRAAMLRAGWLIYAGVYAGFAFWDGPVAPWVLFAIYGVYYGLVEGPERALIADLTPDASRSGAAFGLFHLVVGAAALPASLLCGALWQWRGHQTAFVTGAVLALAACAMLGWALPPASPRQPDSPRQGNRR